MSGRYLVRLEPASAPFAIGNKAEKLRFLMKHGFPTPRSWVCPWQAYQEYLDSDQEVISRLAPELSSDLDLDRSYAVRSSANTEDGLYHSFAGQFKSVLDVRGLDEILEAVRLVWAATRSEAVHAYLSRNGIGPEDLKMAVLIQEMVPPVISGVAFSKNPMTGLDEIVVEAVEGSGEALVQDGVTPARWVSKWGAWTEQPTTDEIGLHLIEEVVQQTKSIAKAYGKPVDLEWVYDGQTVHWVQLREITSLDVDVYSNRIAKEVFPGIIKPLVWSVNVPLVNGAWVQLFTELIGPNDIDPDSLARSFHYRAYFNMGAIGRIFELLGLPRETLELLMGIEGGGPDKPSFKPTLKTYALLPRMLRFAVGKLRFARKIEAFLPRMQRQYRSFDIGKVAQLQEEELIREIDHLYALTQEVAYYNIVTPLLMQIYNAVLKSQLARIGVDFERINPTSDRRALEAFDPNIHLAELNRAFSDLEESIQARIRAADYAQFVQMSGIQALQEGVGQFLARFGHLSDSGNDFSVVPWRESPDLILEMVASYTEPPRQSWSEADLADLDVPPLRRPLLRWVWSRAGQFRLYREAIGSLYTYGYGLFRACFLGLADHFVQRGILSSPDDIFYLSLREVRAIVSGEEAADSYGESIDERRRQVTASKDVILPGLVFGDHAVGPVASATNTLRGTATSRGRHTGPVKVVQGLEEFAKLSQGDVLVIPYSDVGWTPLFGKAGAVIAESGGMLSHSSIVAREYGIPAVVSVPGACRLRDHTVVTVDGYRGEILVQETVAGDEPLEL